MGVLEEFRLDGKSSLVTGGASGIGRAFAEAMAEAGADVVVADIDTEGAEEVADEIADDTGRETLAVEADVTDEDNVETMVSETVDAFGGLDIAFANAGIAELERGAETYETRQWEPYRGRQPDRRLAYRPVRRTRYVRRRRGIGNQHSVGLRSARERGTRLHSRIHGVERRRRQPDADTRGGVG